MRPLHFLIIIFAFFNFHIQAQEPLDSKHYTIDHTLTESDDFHKDQIVYYTKRGEWVEVTNSVNSERKVCILTYGAPLRIVGFSIEQSTVMVEMLSHSPSFACNSGDQFPVNKTSIKK